MNIKLGIDIGNARKGVNCGQLAENLGLCRATITNWRCNKVSVSVDELERLAAFYGVDIIDFVKWCKGE